MLLPTWLGRFGSRVASRVSLYGLASDVESQGNGQARGVEWSLPVSPSTSGIVCRLQPGIRIQFETILRGRAAFSAIVGLDHDGNGGAPPAGVGLSISVGEPGGPRRWSATRLVRGAGRENGNAPEAWRVPLGRFRGGAVEIVLEVASSGPEGGAPVVLRNPSVSVEPDLASLLPRAIRKLWRMARAEGIAGTLCDLVGVLDGEWGRLLRYRLWMRRPGGTTSRLDGVAQVLDESRDAAPFATLLAGVGAETGKRAVRRLLDSLAAQHLPAWEALVVIDAAASPSALDAARQGAAADSRVRLLEGGGDHGAALDRALGMARGTFVGLLPVEGVLAPDALAEMRSAADRQSDADVIYSDEDRLDRRGRRGHPFFKPDWSPYYFLSYPYLGQLWLCRTGLAREAGGFGGAATGLDDYDLLLRVTARARRVQHVPRVLWHRCAGAPDAALPFGRDGAAGERAVRRYLQHAAQDAEVGPGLLPGTQRVRWRLRGAPLVSVVILTRDRVHLLRRCLAGLEARTAYRDLEIVVVDNGSVEPATRGFLDRCGARVVRSEGPFNFSRLCNVGVREARGSHLLFLNNDTEPSSDGWLGAMLELSQRRDVGAVGAKLYYPDGRLQHVGIVVGINGTAAQTFRGATGAHPGYAGRAMAIHECAAVTGACLMTRREVFEAVGGFDEAFAVDYNDVDYCLRVLRRGYRVLFTPFASLFHHEFGTRLPEPRPDEAALFQQRWPGVVDPYYNPNLSLRHTDCSVEVAPARRTALAEAGPR